jgi:hypothetical protein
MADPKQHLERRLFLTQAATIAGAAGFVPGHADDNPGPAKPAQDAFPTAPGPYYSLGPDESTDLAIRVFASLRLTSPMRIV